MCEKALPFSVTLDISTAMTAAATTTILRIASWLLLQGAVVAATLRMEPADSPVDNPLKGLVPYAGKSAERFPHSLEFDYLPLAKLLTGPGQYHWQALDDKHFRIAKTRPLCIFCHS